jgi:hypothetical protein
MFSLLNAVLLLHCHIEQGGIGLTLRRLSLWSIDPIDRLKLMAQLTQGAGTLQVYTHILVSYTVLHQYTLECIQCCVHAYSMLQHVTCTCVCINKM